MDPFVKGQKIVIHGVWNVPFLFNQPSRREESKTRTHVLFKFYHGEKSVSGRQNQPEHSVTVWFAEELVLVHLFSEAHSAELVHLQSKIDLYSFQKKDRSIYRKQPTTRWRDALLPPEAGPTAGSCPIQPRRVTARTRSRACGNAHGHGEYEAPVGVAAAVRSYMAGPGAP